MKTSILVHNRDRADELGRCLASVAELRTRPTELVLLDAGSTDGSQEVIATSEQKLRAAGFDTVIGDCVPLGVAASRNLLASKATGSLLLFLDNDASVEVDDGLERVVRRFAEEPDLGLLSCRILYRDSQDVDPQAWVFRRPSSPWQSRRFPTFTFAGGCFCVRREAFEAAGRFWGVLPYAREEEDFALALLDRGWRIDYDPAITIRHYPSAGGRMGLGDRRRVELRNGAMVLYRRLPLPLVPLAIAARLVTMSVMSRREGHGLRVLWGGLPEARKLWREKGCERSPVKWRTVARYLMLHRRKGEEHR